MPQGGSRAGPPGEVSEPDAVPWPQVRRRGGPGRNSSVAAGGTPRDL